MITDRDLLLATAQRKRDERLLYYAEFVGESVKTALAHYGFTSFGEFAKEMGFFCYEGLYPKRKPDAPVFDYRSYFKDMTIPEGVKIESDGVLNLPGSTHHFTHLISPLRNIYDLEDIMQFPIYKKPEYYDFSSMKDRVAQVHQSDKAIIAWVGRFFETSWPLRGYENMLADMLTEPEIADYFLNLQLDWNMAFAEHAVKAGADALYFGDDVGSQKGMTFSADLWRKMIKPKWAKVFSLAKSINKNIVLWYHSCGGIAEIIPDLIEIGLDILNPIQPECMDIYAIQKKYGDKLSFDGGLGTQTVMPFGTPEQVMQETKRLVEVFGANGGYILAPTHVLEPEVPIENIDAFIKTAKQVCVRA
jgi:uroporphyrinogen decarboxylase